MATTVDDLLIRVSYDSSGAIKGLKTTGSAVGTLTGNVDDLDEALRGMNGTINKVSDSSVAMFKDLLSEANKVIASTQDITRALEEQGLTELELVQKRASGRIEDIRYLESNLKLNGLLTDTLADQLRQAKEAVTAKSRVDIEAINLEQAKASAAAAASAAQVAGAEKAREAELANVAAMKQAAETQERLTRAGSMFNVAATKSASVFRNIGAGIIVANQAMDLFGRAFRIVDKVILGSIKSFQMARDEQRRLTSTLEILGDKAVDKTVRRFTEFSKALADNSRAEDETILRLLTLGRQMGLTDKQAEDLVQTSSDLAASLREDVTTSFNRLQATLKGSARGITELNPAFAGMGTEALKAGKAVKMIGDQLSGQAAADIKTFGGQIAQAEKLLGEFQKAAGEGILLGLGIDPDSVVDMQKFKDVLEDVAPAVAAVVGAIKSLLMIITDLLILGITPILGPMRIFTGLVTDIIDAVQNFDIGKFKGALNDLLSGNFKAAAEQISDMAGGFSNLQEETAAVGETIKGSFGDIIDQVTGANDALEDTAKTVDKVKKAGKGLKLPPIVSDEAIKTLDELKKKLNDLASSAGANAASETDQARLKATAAFQEINLLEEKLKKNKALTAEAKKQIAFARQTISSGLGADIGVITKKGIDEIRDATLDLATQASAAMNSQEEQLDMQLALQTAIINKQQDKLRLEGAANAEQVAALDVQKELLKQITARAKVEAYLSTLDPRAATAGKAAGDTTRAASEYVTKAAALFGKEVGRVSEGTINRITTLVAGSVDKILPVLDGIFGTAAAMFSPETINGFAEFLQGIDKLPQELLKAFGKLDKVISNLIDKFPQMLDKLLDALPGIFDKILSALPKLIDTLFDGLGRIVDMLPGLFQKLFDALPDLISQILKRLPELIKKVFSALGDIVAELIVAIPDIFKAIVDELPNIVESIIEGMISAMGKVVGAFVNDFVLGGGAERMVGALLRAIPKLIVAIVQGIARGLANAVKSIFGGLKIKIPGVSDLGDKVSDGLKKIVDSSKGVTDSVFKVIDMGAAAKAKGVADDIRDAVVNATETMREVYNGLMDKLIALWRWVYDTILKPIIDMFYAVWQFFGDLWTAVVKPIIDALISGLQAVWEFIQPIFDAFVAGVQALWDFAKSIFETFVTNTQKVWEFFKTTGETFLNGLRAIWDGLKNLVSDAFASIREFFSKLFKGDIEGAFKTVIDYFKSLPKALTDAVKTAGTTIWDGLKDAFGKGTDTFKKIGTSIWDGLKDGLGNVGATIKTQLDKLNPSNLFEKIFKMDMKGTGKVEGILGIDVPYANFASGGVLGDRGATVPGDSILNDRILAMLSPGEAVIPRSAMANPEVKRIVAAILNGSAKVPMFRYGVKDAKKDLSNATGGGGGGGLGSVLGDLASAGKAGFEGLGDLGDEAMGYLETFLGGLDPTQLWEKVLGKVADGVMEMFHANAFADGGIVGGGTMSAPSRPITLPSSFGNGNGGGNTPNVTQRFEINVTVNTTNGVDGAKLGKQIRDELMADSRAGRPVIDRRGLR